MKAFWPEELSHYTSRKLLGAGQYGLVYRVLNPRLNQYTVIKLIEVTQSIEDTPIKRFKREIQALQKVQSPHIVKMLQYWIEPHFVAFEMEYIPGISLADFIKLLSIIPYSRKESIIQNIIIQIATGLSHLHAQELVHRDLKPSNILLKTTEFTPDTEAEEIFHRLNEEGFIVKITDMGVVKDLSATVSITRTGDFIGTASYIAPEQATGSKITAFCDMYSLGIIWYEMITGHNPFYRKNIYNTIHAHLHEEAPGIQQFVPEISLEISHILSLLLQKQPEDRFYTSELLLNVLRQRQTSGNETPYDVSLLIPRTSYSESECQLEKTLISYYQNQSPDGSITIVPYSEIQSIYHLRYHLNNVFFQENYRTIVPYFPTNPSRLFAFFQAAIEQLSPEEVQILKNQLDPNSPETYFLNLILTENFFEQCNLNRKYLDEIPFQIKFYNALILFHKIIKIISSTKPVIILITNIANLYRHFPNFFQIMFNLLSNEPIHWVITIPHFEYGSLLDKFPEYHLFQIEQDTAFERIPSTCPIQKTWLPTDYQETFPPYDEMDIEANSTQLADLSVSEEERHFLEYLAVAGFFNPINYVNWLLETKFHKNGQIVLSLIQKRIIFQDYGISKTLFLGFRNMELFRALFFSISEKKQHQLLEEITSYWELQTDLISRERLLHYYLVQRKNSRVVQILSDLVDFYIGILDIVRINQILSLLNSLENTYKLPVGRKLHFYLRQQAVSIISHQFETMLIEPDEFIIEASNKYWKEKTQIFVFKAYAALLLKDFERTQHYIQLAENNLEPNNDSPFLLFVKALWNYYHQETSRAIELINRCLSLWNQQKKYWYIPLGSYTLAFFLFRKRDWFNSYKYATLSFHAAKVINDFWVESKSVELINQNPYYRENREALLNWQALLEQDIHFPSHHLDAFDLRSKLYSNHRGDRNEHRS